MTTIAIIGAGMSGLTAAHTLTKHGYSVIIYEKSRGVGGRVTTRRVDDWRIDHGAQVINMPDEATTALLRRNPMPIRLTAPVWVFDQHNTISPGNPDTNALPRWCWHDGIVTPARALATGLDIRTQVTVHHIEPHNGGYRLFNDDGQRIGRADAVVLTPPAPQTAAILANSLLPADLAGTLHDLLAAASYRPCLSVAFAYRRQVGVPWYALVNTDRQHTVAWLACEHNKPGHAPEGYSLIIAQLAPDYSRAHWDDATKGMYGSTDTPPMPAYIQAVDGMVQRLIGSNLGDPLWANLHRWRYALPDSAADFDALNSTASRLYFAGDYVDRKGRVHQVMQRGQQVAELIMREVAP